MSWNVKRDNTNNVQTFYDEETAIKAPILLADRYEIKDILSVSGGYGIIYRAEDRRLNNRKVLVKARRYDNNKELFLHQMDKNRKEAIQNIRKEIITECRNLVDLKKDGEARIPSVNDFVMGYSPTLHGPHKSKKGDEFYYEDEAVYNNEPYIIMQIIEGETLSACIAKGLPRIMEERKYRYKREWERDVLGYCNQIATILEGFHKIRPDDSGEKCMFVYQDLKPENIMITENKFITLLDFGAMLKVKVTDDGKLDNDDNVVKPGTGTPGFRPREMLSGAYGLKNLDQRADIYSLGATAYYLLTFTHPLLAVNVEGERLPLSELENQYTAATCNIIKKCTEIFKEDRYENMAMLKRDIFEAFKSLKGKK